MLFFSSLIKSIPEHKPAADRGRKRKTAGSLGTAPRPKYYGKRRRRQKKFNPKESKMTEIIAEAVNQMGNISGSIQGALGCLGAALGVGFVGAKAVEATGRNPGAFGKIMVLGILGMALAEAVAFYSLFLGK